jgi:GMP synthase (glutamine-hydrolysing)
VRELNVYCELYSCLVEPALLAQVELHGVILSGGPASVYDPESPHVHPEVWELIKARGVPVLGICYGMQEITHVFGGEVSKGAVREFGKAVVKKVAGADALGAELFGGMDDPEGYQMWMSHGDKVTKLPDGFAPVAATDACEYAAIGDGARKIWGLQFHPEVTHSPRGKDLLRNFVVGICEAPTTWNMQNLAERFIEQVRVTVGEEGHVIGAVSGGVDSTVAAVLMQRAIGDRFHAILVDNGCLRKEEAPEVVARLKDELGINLRLMSEENRFLTKLSGVTEPEKKRKIIGNLFIECFQEAQSEMTPKPDFLLQGTLYPDVIESISYKGPSATIKTHHNVGGLPAHMKLSLIEPLRELFKDEVRALGVVLGVPANSVWRHPFPGPGLAIRVLGEVTAERLAMARAADAILIEELRSSNEYGNIGQAFVVLLDCKSVGVMGDGRTYENACAVRCVETTDYMTADWYHLPYEVLGRISTRIINEVRGINRVCYDISSKPPATIEWE